MKVVAKPIHVYALTDTKGQIHPMSLRLEENQKVRELNIDRIVTITKESLAGNAVLIYECESEIKGMLWPFELKYEMNTCKWTLFRI